MVSLAATKAANACVTRGSHAASGKPIWTLGRSHGALRRAARHDVAAASTERIGAHVLVFAGARLALSPGRPHFPIKWYVCGLGLSLCERTTHAVSDQGVGCWALGSGRRAWPQFSMKCVALIADSEKSMPLLPMIPTG